MHAKPSVLVLFGALISIAVAGWCRAEDSPPVDPAALRAELMTAMQEERWDDAEATLDRLLTLEPGNPAHMYNRACVEARRGDAAEAIAWLGRAADAGFADSGLVARDTDLSAIRADPAFAEIEARIRAKDPMRQMDFWVGEWEVFDTSGKRVGENIIVVRNKGRMIFEQWEDVNGWVGCSQNFFDAGEGKWRQIWTDEAGGVVEYTGVREADGMRFEGTALARAGVKMGSRMTLTILPDGAVRQHIERQQPDGSWATAVDFRYVRRGE